MARGGNVVFGRVISCNIAERECQGERIAFCDTIFEVTFCDLKFWVNLFLSPSEKLRNFDGNTYKKFFITFCHDT